MLNDAGLDGVPEFDVTQFEVPDRSALETADLKDPVSLLAAETVDANVPYDGVEIARVALQKYRRETGWYQVTDRPDAPGNYPEASGSAMFVYMLAKAVNEGYLGPEYREVAAEIWSEVVRQFISVEASGEVSLENICAVAGLGFGRDGSYRYYMGEPIMDNDPKGTGPFIMAGIQVSRMLRQDR